MLLMDKSLAADTALLAALMEGGQAADAALVQLYHQNRAQIGQLVLNNQGDEAAAKDIMQESMIALYENVRAGRFKGASKLSTYLYGIARLLWLNRLKRARLETQKLEQIQAEVAIEALPNWMLEGESKAAIQRLLSTLGQACQKVLVDNIYFGYDMRAIARRMNFSNEQVARNKKHRCLKKLKQLIQEQPELLHELTQT